MGEEQEEDHHLTRWRGSVQEAVGKEGRPQEYDSLPHTQPLAEMQ
jgi:hypothetical protein